MEKVAGETGKLEVVSTEDLSILTADRLREFDGVYFYTSGELALTATQKSDLLAFVRDGKGFGGAHSATDTLYSWPEYGEMIGSYFDGHPWVQEAGIDIEDPNHPAARNLAPSWRIVEEFYQFRQFSRDRVRVLMTLDTRTVDLTRPGIEIINARLSKKNTAYADFLYERLQRKGYLFRDAQRLINNDRNHFAACMVALGDADSMVTGVTRNFSVALEDVRRCIDPKPGHRVIGVSLVLAPRGRTVIVADTAVTEMPNAKDLAEIAVEVAGVARRLGYEPRVALLAFSTFGHPPGERAAHVQEAVRLLDQRRVDFEYDGEMAADVALSTAAMAPYPFCRLSGPANVLIMPAWHSASISTKLLQELGGSTVIGPLLVGLDKPVQIV